MAVACTPWRMSVGAEVFALHMALVAALLALLALWREFPARRRTIVAWGAFVFGLGCAHHQTIVLLLLPLGLYFWLCHRENGQQGWGFSWLVWPMFALGLLPYLYLPWKAAQQPVLNWGDPSSWQRFLWVVLRRGYGGVQLSTASAPSYAWGHALLWLKSLFLSQYPLFGAALGCWAVYACRAQRKAEMWLFLVITLMYGPVWALIAHQPAGDGYVDMLERFYSISYLGFAGLLALGLDYLIQDDGTNRPMFRRREVWAILIILACGLFLNAYRCSERQSYLISDSIAAIEKVVPPGAMLVTGNDLTSGAIMYAVAVEGRDIRHIPSGVVNSEWFSSRLSPEQAQAVERGGLEGLMVYERSQGHEVYSDAVLPQVRGFFVPVGLAYRYLAPGEPESPHVQIAMESLVVLEETPRRDRHNYGQQYPFWLQFFSRRWREAYGVLIDSLPAGSQARQVAEERSRGRERE